jgi:hypothetical protein
LLPEVWTPVNEDRLTQTGAIDMDDKSKHQGQGSEQDPKGPGMADPNLQDDRNREEAGKPVQLDEKGQAKKPGMAQSGGGQHGQQQGGQHGQQGGAQQGGSPQGGQNR